MFDLSFVSIILRALRENKKGGRGEEYLNPPTPIPKTTRPTEKHPKDPWGCVITDGNAEIIKMI